MKKMNNKGFSLVELIIVIAIMAILIGVLAPQYLKYVEKSRVSADKDLLDSVYTACTITAADPEFSNAAPSSDTSLSSLSGSFADEVMSTLGAANASSVEAKLKSKSCKGQGISINVDSNGNFTIECGGVKVPEQ